MADYREILKRPNRPKIGVTISSGGPKAAAGAALFDFLDQANIPIDMLLGCSGGSITCGMKAIGYTGQEIKEAWQKLGARRPFKADFKSFAAALNLPFTSFSKGQGFFHKEPLLDIFKMVYGQRTLIEDTKIPLYIQTTNVDTGEGIIQSKGLLHEAVYASSAALPFFPPININGQWYADGYFSSPLPIMPLVAKGIDIIIAVNVQPYSMYRRAFEKGGLGYFKYYDNFFQMSLASATAFQNSLAVDQHHHEIIFIDVPLEHNVALWEVEKLPYIFEKGQEGVEKTKDEIIRAIELFRS